MRKNNLLDALFPRIRQGILAATMMHPERWWYLSDLARHLGVTPSSLQRELTSLVDTEILTRRQEGRQVYYRSNPDCPILLELRGIMIKTAGLVDVLRQTLYAFGDLIDYAFIYGSIARAEEWSDSDIDLMIIGQVGLSDLAPSMTAAEQQLGRSVNLMVYHLEEWVAKLTEGHHFLQTVFAGDKLFLIGTLHDLATASDPASHSTAHHQQAGTR